MSTKKLTFGPTIITLLITGFLLVIVPLLRNILGNSFTSGVETYTYLSVANASMPTFYNFLLDQLVSFFSLQVAIIVLPLFFGIGSLLLFILLIHDHVNKTILCCLMAVVLALTPAFLAMHIGFTLYAALLFFTLLSYYFFVRKKYFYLLFIAVLFLLDPLYTTFFSAGLFFLDFFKKENKHALVVLMFHIVLIFASAFFPFAMHYDFSFSFALDQLFSFLGGRYGYSLFLILLGMGGFLSLHTTSKSGPRRLLQAIIILLSFVYEPARIIGILLLSYYSVQGFRLLLTRQWYSKSLQQLTILLFICILIFSTASFLKEEVQSSPTTNQIEALTYLRATIASHPSHADVKIISNPKNAPFVRFFSSLDVEQTRAQELLASQSFSYVSSLFQQENISFVFVEPSMFQGEIWQREKEGLLFVMHHNSRFKKIYDASGHKIYYYLDWNEDTFTS